MPVKEDAQPTTTHTPPPAPPRRQFLRLLLGGSMLASLGTFLYPVMRYLVPPAEADLGAESVVAAALNELKVNTAKIFRFGSKPGLLIRTGQNEYRAVAATCTHLSCTVQYSAENSAIVCACHNGRFDLSGRNVGGPPPRPLELFDVHVRGEEVVVARKREA